MIMLYLYRVVEVAAFELAVEREWLLQSVLPVIEARRLRVIHLAKRVEVSVGGARIQPAIHKRAIVDVPVLDLDDGDARVRIRCCWFLAFGYGSNLGWQTATVALAFLGILGTSGCSLVEDRLPRSLLIAAYQRHREFILQLWQWL